MAQPRLVLLLICFLALPTFLTFFSLLYSHTPKGQLATESSTIHNSGRLLAFFSFRAPSTLFPSSAIISLTDDNSTFFLARPADFGPGLVPEGFSGQLWVGSGFGDDSLKNGRIPPRTEGELGCSDVPGWGERELRHHGDSDTQAAHINHAGNGPEDGKSLSNTGRPGPRIRKEDGTDDHLQELLLGSSISKASEVGKPTQHGPDKNRSSPPNADIRLLQESAEITGRIVLLSRGGCGFLEKVKWTQRRGGAALIVGDDTRGGPLITMFARGDTSNITIPSLFTSYTTAHLLSTLIPSEGATRTSRLKDLSKIGQSDGGANGVEWSDRGIETQKLDNDRAIFTHTATGPKSTTGAQPSLASPQIKSRRAQGADMAVWSDWNSGWWHFLLSGMGFGTRSRISDLSADSRRPPSSGRLDYTGLQITPKNNLKQENAFIDHASDLKGRTLSPRGPVDDFIIGVQDWRDKDLIPAQRSAGNVNSLTDKPTSKAKPLPLKSSASIGEKLTGIVHANAGGIITPGSGEYEDQGPEPLIVDTLYLANGAPKSDEGSPARLTQKYSREEKENGMLQELSIGTVNQESASQQTQGSLNIKHQNVNHLNEEHQGLWVTLTPTTMSTSPFLDTLLVLVVSPLITLTVVYALLLLRSRIRRRRWRAPKSVVDRLPVRTYHTMSSSSTSSSSQFATPLASSPTSPLLQTYSQSASSCPRSRSRTTSIDSVAEPLVPDKAEAIVSFQQLSNHTCQPAGKRKYTGRQIECVVCLEEYVDGHSRVMSLPCGHEFHAECM